MFGNQVQSFFLVLHQLSSVLLGKQTSAKTVLGECGGLLHDAVDTAAEAGAVDATVAVDTLAPHDF